MRPVTLSQTGVGSTAVLVPDVAPNPFNMGIGVRVNGTVNYTVEHTFDDIFATTFNPGTATWFPHTTLVAQTANAVGNYAFAVRGIRLTVNSGTGSATATFVQSGIGGN
jgi:hypothetical protein